MPSATGSTHGGQTSSVNGPTAILRDFAIRGYVLDKERLKLTNASLRARFGVGEKNKAAVSRYIREAVKGGMIKPFDEDAARKMMKYVPFWA